MNIMIEPNQIFIVGNIQNCFTNLVCAFLYQGYRIVYKEGINQTDLLNYLTQSLLIISNSKETIDRLILNINDRQNVINKIPVIIGSSNRINKTFDQILKVNQMLNSQNIDNLRRISGEMKKFCRDQIHTTLFYDRYLFEKINDYITFQVLKTDQGLEKLPINRAMIFIEKNYSRHISLNEISKVASLSPCYFCRQFKTQTGMTFNNYLTFTRIRIAKQLITDTQKSITDISYTIGYEELGSFERAVRKIEGLSPIQYRARHTLESNKS
jgi:YesN/AraC family two-component response regulator